MQRRRLSLAAMRSCEVFVLLEADVLVQVHVETCVEFWDGQTAAFQTHPLQNRFSHSSSSLVARESAGRNDEDVTDLQCISNQGVTKDPWHSIRFHSTDYCIDLLPTDIIGQAREVTDNQVECSQQFALGLMFLLQ